jgi:hypothetical protein
MKRKRDNKKANKIEMGIRWDDCISRGLMMGA